MWGVYFANFIMIKGRRLQEQPCIDPLGRPTVTVGSDHCFFAHIVCPSVPTFQNKAKTMFATGETVGLAEWIIDDTCLVSIDSHTVWLNNILD